MPNIRKRIPKVTEITSDTCFPWELRHDLKETHDAYRRFCMYRDMQDMKGRHKRKSFSELAEILDLKVQSLYAIAKKYRWKERIKAYDDWLERQAREELESKIIEMHTRHADYAVSMVRKAREKLEETPIEKLTVNDAIKMIELGVKTERAARSDKLEQPLRRKKLEAEIALLEKTENAEMVKIIDDLNGIEDDLIDEGDDDA